MQLRLVPTALAVAVAVLSSFSCGGPKARDLRVEIPAAEKGMYDLVTTEQIIEPGEEKMFCTDFVYHGEDVAMWKVDARQGKFGHHVILLGSKKPKPEGTTYDCTDISTMKDFEPFAIMDLPEGSGTPLPANKPLVIQMHYVNTSTEPILVRDVIRIGIKPQSEITRWVAPFGLNSGNFEVPPRAAEFTTTFDCTVKQDADLLLLGGHMHENGMKMFTQLGTDVNNLVTKYQVDAWKPDYRDAPPVELFMSTPIKVKAGMILRTSCTWTNSSDKTLTFPHEMCASFGLLAGTKDSWVCNIGVTE